jgi:hypothetical protein
MLSHLFDALLLTVVTSAYAYAPPAPTVTLAAVRASKQYQAHAVDELLSSLLDTLRDYAYNGAVVD